MNDVGIISIGVGNFYLGSVKKGPDGQTISKTPPRWEDDPAGGCVAVWPVDPETKEQTAPAEVFGDWQAAQYLAKALELLAPHRQINVPDLEAIIKSAAADGCDICDYCPDGGYRCRDCIVNEWKSAADD